MANTKISALSSASALGGTEEIPLNQGGTTKRATVNQVQDYFEGIANTFLVGQKIHGSANESQLDLKGHSTQTVPLMRALSNAGVRQCFMGAGHWNAGSDDYRMQVGNNGLGLYSVLRICWGAGGPYNNDGDMFNVADAGLRRAAAGFVAPTDGNSNGGAGIEFVQKTSGGTPGTNAARIYAKDVSGTAEIFVLDEAGNETQISPHRMDGPAWLYDLDDPLPLVSWEAQHYLGVVRYVNRSRLDDAGFLIQHDWHNEQELKQLRYDELREHELAEKAKFDSLPENKKPSVVPVVSEEKDIRKPMPLWMQARFAALSDPREIETPTLLGKLRSWLGG